MNRVVIAVLVWGLLCARAEAHFERSAAVARSQGMGRSFVSLADDASSLFVNPAGMLSAGSAECYLDYAEPAGNPGSRETRGAISAGTARTRFGVGWYRLGLANDESDDLFVVSAARKLIEGTQGSFLSLGANALIGRIAFNRACCAAKGSSWSDVAGDFGLILKPLPVISIGYAIANAFKARFDGVAAGSLWERTQRWGVSYFWENRAVFSIGEEHAAGRTEFHCGLSVRTETPLEIMAGFSDGNVTGGVRWTGASVSATVSFMADGERGVTWIGACEIAVRREKNEGAR